MGLLRLNFKKRFFYLMIFVVLIYLKYRLRQIKKEIDFKPDIDLANAECNPFIYVHEKNLVSFNGTLYPQSYHLSLSRSINFSCLQMSQKIKRIFLWNTFGGDPNFELKIGVETPFKQLNCPVTNCEITNDKKKFNESDLVIVHMGDIIKPIPAIRPEKQRWVFYFFESQNLNYPNFKQYNGIFNLRSTHQIDSDFAGHYETESKMYWIKNNTFDENHDFSAGKSGLAAALISNCFAKSKRLEYIKEMQKYAPVKIFGKCGESCNDKYLEVSSYDCRWKISKQFKFYLAFENAICKDYITEKFFHILRHDIVPVVLGGGNYDYFIPKSAYIDVRDFESPKKLVEYLLYLDSNKVAYNSYFKWKKYVSFLDNEKQYFPFCNMCVKLQLERFTGFKKKYIYDIEEFRNKHQCIDPFFKGDQFVI